jgi:hypothetical protein
VVQCGVYITACGQESVGDHDKQRKRNDGKQTYATDRIFDNDKIQENFAYNVDTRNDRQRKIKEHKVRIA